MIQRGFGRVINISSSIQRRPAEMAYACSKAALDKFVHDLAPSLQNTGVMIIMSVWPGYVRIWAGPRLPMPWRASSPGSYWELCWMEMSTAAGSLLRIMRDWTCRRQYRRRNFTTANRIERCPTNLSDQTISSRLAANWKADCFWHKGLRACSRGALMPQMFCSAEDVSGGIVTKDFIIEKRKQYIRMLNEDHSEMDCKRCLMVERKRYGDISFSRLGHVDLQHYSMCNLRCAYCAYTRDDMHFPPQYDALAVLQLFSSDEVEWNAHVDFAGGEPTLSENLEEYLAFFRDSPHPGAYAYQCGQVPSGNLRWSCGWILILGHDLCRCRHTFHIQGATRPGSVSASTGESKPLCCRGEQGQGHALGQVYFLRF